MAIFNSYVYCNYQRVDVSHQTSALPQDQFRQEFDFTAEVVTSAGSAVWKHLRWRGEDQYEYVNHESTLQHTAARFSIHVCV